MRPHGLLALALAIALSGCSTPGSDEAPSPALPGDGASAAEPDERPRGDAADRKAPIRRPIGTDSPDHPYHVETNETGRVYGLDVAALPYENTIMHSAIVADAPQSIELTMTGQLATHFADDGCVAWGFLVEDAQGKIRSSYAAIAWYVPIEGAGVMLQGESIYGMDPSYEQVQAPGERIEASFTLNLTTGDRLVTYGGGTHPRFFDGESYTVTGPQADPAVQNHLRFNATARLATHALDGPAREVQCGVGARGLHEDATGAHYAYVVAQLGGAQRLASTNGSTLMWRPDGVEQQSVRLDFLGDEADGAETYLRTEPEAGALGIEVDHFIAPFARSQWLMVDAYWPALTASAP